VVQRGVDTMFDDIDLRAALKRAIASLPTSTVSAVVLIDVQDRRKSRPAECSRFQLARFGRAVPWPSDAARTARGYRRGRRWRRAHIVSPVRLATERTYERLTLFHAPRSFSSLGLPDGELPADRADGISRHLEACAGAGPFRVERTFARRRDACWIEAPAVPELRDRNRVSPRDKGFRGRR